MKQKISKRKQDIKPDAGVVERTHSWMNRFRRILIRWEKGLIPTLPCSTLHAELLHGMQQVYWDRLLVVKYDDWDKEYYAFATNFEIKYTNDIERIVQLYRKRWGIETGYRVKRDFLAITTTECYIVRMLYFMVPVILYNFWLLCNLVYCREHEIELGTQELTARIMKLYIGENITGYFDH